MLAASVAGTAAPLVQEMKMVKMLILNLNQNLLSKKIILLWSICAQLFLRDFLRPWR